MPEANLQHTESKTRDGTGLGRIVFGLSTIAVFTKALGFAEKMVVARFWGTSDNADVYFATMGIVLSIVFLIKELVYPSLLPVLAESLRLSPALSSRLFRKTLLWAVAAISAALLLLIFFADEIVGLMVWGFTEPKKALAASLLRCLVPAVLFLGLSTVTYTTLNAHKRFLRAALPDTLMKLLVIVSLIIMIPKLGIDAVALAVGLGALVYFVAQLLFIPRRVSLSKETSEQANAQFNKVLLLMGPLVLGVVFSHISGLVDNLLASTLPSGHLSYLGYSKKLIDAILLIGPVALITVVYSHLSHLASSKDHAEFKRLVLKSARILLYLSVPVTCLLICLKEPIIRTLFERGQFSAESTAGTSYAFAVYSIGLVALSLESLVVYSFFALSNTKIPVTVGIICVILDIILAVVFLKPFGYIGIAGAFVISKTVKVAILFHKLNIKLEGLFSIAILRFLGKLLAATAASVAAMLAISAIDANTSFASLVALDLLLPSAGALLIFVICSHLLGMDEYRQILSILVRRKLAVEPIGEAIQ